jgi:hypothetical protein
MHFQYLQLSRRHPSYSARILPKIHPSFDLHSVSKMALLCIGMFLPTAHRSSFVSFFLYSIILNSTNSLLEAPLFVSWDKYDDWDRLYCVAVGPKGVKVVKNPDESSFFANVDADTNNPNIEHLAIRITELKCCIGEAGLTVWPEACRQA